MGVKERREREREARRTLVLDATRSLVRERGFNGTTTKQIAKECELSEATIFWYFKTKDEILASLLFEGIEFMNAGLESIRLKDGTSDEKLLHLWRFFDEVRNHHPEYFHLFGYLGQPGSTASVADEVKDLIAQRSGDSFRLFAELLDEIIDTDNTRIVADLLWGSFVGLMVLRDSRQNMGATPHPTCDDLRAALEILSVGLKKSGATSKVE
jgi:AcrR family transcriptional regulator